MQPYLKNQQLCFFHVPKTAGTTVLHLLRTHFGQENVFHATRPGYLTRPIARLFGAHPVVAGHFSARYLSSDILSKTFVFTFLRNPLQRILSLYSYYRSLPEDADSGDPDVRLAKAVELKEILSSHASPGTLSPWSNHQTAIFSGCNLNRPVDEAVFEQAKHNLEQFSFVGIQEELGRGVQDLFLRIGAEHPPETPILNKTINRLEVDSVDQDTTGLIAEHNQFDHALYLHAKKLWKEGHVPPPAPRIITDLALHGEHGSLEIEATSISLKDGQRQVMQGRPWTLLIRAKCCTACADLTAGILISDEAGSSVYGTNSWLKGNRWGILPNNTFTVEMHFATMTLAKGKYDVTVSFHTGRDTTEKCFHWIDKAFQFEVVEAVPQDFIGMTDLGAHFALVTDPRESLAYSPRSRTHESLVNA